MKVALSYVIYWSGMFVQTILRILSIILTPVLLVVMWVVGLVFVPTEFWPEVFAWAKLEVEKHRLRRQG